jgi:hypothetical protein
MRYLNGSSKNKLERFKSESTRLNVNLLEAEIKSNKWTEEVMTDETKYAGLNQLNGEPEKNFRIEEKVVSHLKIRAKYNGKTIEYGQNVNMESDNLRIHLELQKETYLYVDPKNIENKYLDLEFMER